MIPSVITEPSSLQENSRDNIKSTVVVSQFPVKSWYDLFADNTYADACLDRIVHKAYRLELNGKNMRNPG